MLRLLLRSRLECDGNVTFWFSWAFAWWICWLKYVQLFYVACQTGSALLLNLPRCLYKHFCLPPLLDRDSFGSPLTHDVSGSSSLRSPRLPSHPQGEKAVFVPEKGSSSLVCTRTEWICQEEFEWHVDRRPYKICDSGSLIKSPI